MVTVVVVCAILRCGSRFSGGGVVVVVVVGVWGSVWICERGEGCCVWVCSSDIGMEVVDWSRELR